MQTESVDTPHERSLRVVVLCLDALIVVASMACSWGLHKLLRDVDALQTRIELRTPPSFEQYALLLYLTLPVFLAVTAAFGLHRSFERRSGCWGLALGLGKVHFGVLTVLSLMLFLTQTVINRSILGLFLTCTFILQFAVRALLGRWQSSQHSKGHTRARILLVGAASREIDALVERCRSLPFPPEIVGCLDDGAAPSVRMGAGGAALKMVPQRGRLPDLARILHQEPIDRVLFFPPFNDPAGLGSALALCETLGVPAALAVDMTPQSVAVPRIAFLFGLPFVEFELAPRPPGPLLLKHSFDVLAATVLLALAAPLLLLTALSILVTMGRPILFVQERAGLRGRPFRMLKFRTMVTDAEARKESLRAQNIMGGPVFKLRDDPRVTPLGRWLRSSSIDELPQLFNVLTGEMSLVGPRPLPRAEQEEIQGWHRRRLSMKPGITGLWQVSGRSDVAFDQWMKLDLTYIDTWSWKRDLSILLRTIPALLHRRGAH